MLYFAYGSNLLTARLRARCASARVVGTARLEGFHVAMAKQSWLDPSGKATILEGGAAEGVVFELSEAELATLDAIEGVGKGYDRCAVAVDLRAERVGAVTYIATDPQPGLVPFDWYLALVLAGAAEHGLGGVRAAMAHQVHSPDPDPARPGHVMAIEALSAAGHTDWRRLLPAQDGAASNSSS